MSRKDWKKHFIRMKQLANQNLGRAEKSAVLSEDLLELEKRVDVIRAVCQDTVRRLSSCHPVQHNNDVDKRRRKLPQMVLAASMVHSASLLGEDEDILGRTYNLCSSAQQDLAELSFQHSQDVENIVLAPFHRVLEKDIPLLLKLRKQLSKLTLDMDAAKTRYQSAVKQQLVSSNSNASLSQLSSTVSKADTIRIEMEEAENRVEQCKDQLVTEMYSFFARESELNEVLLSLLEVQTEYHRQSLHALEACLPKLKEHIEQSVQKVVFGCPLEAHLRNTGSEVSVVLEQCIGAILQYGISEEGIFRVAASGSRVKKLKAAFDANVVDMEDYKNDIHCVASTLKMYLRELPEPLMTFDLYDEWMRLLELSPSARQNSMWVVVDKLPKANFNNLRYLMKFLSRLALNSYVNKMTAANLAIVIAPSLLWPRSSDVQPTTTGSTIQAANAHSSIIEQLINKAEWYFPGDVEFLQTSNRRQMTLCNRRNASPCSSRSIHAVSPVPNETASGLLSLPAFKPSRPSSSAPRFQMSSSLMERNESWSSFSSLHSLPETFFTLSHNGAGGISARPLVIENHGVFVNDHEIRTAPVDADQRTSVETTCRTATFTKQMSYPGVAESLEFSSCRAADIHVFDSSRQCNDLVASGNDATLKSGEQLKQELKLMEEKSFSKSFAHSTNVVFNNLMRAKSFTSKTLRKLNPKLGLGSKSIDVNGSGGNSTQLQINSGNPTRPKSATNRFSMARHKSLEPRLSIDSTDSLSLPRIRERSPLAGPDSVFVESEGEKNDSSTERDAVSKVLFGVGSDTEQEEIEPKLPTGTGRFRALSCTEQRDLSLVPSLATDQLNGASLAVVSWQSTHVSEPDILKAQPDFKPSSHSNECGQSQPARNELSDSMSTPRSRLTIDALTQPAVLASPESSSMSSESPTSLSRLQMDGGGGGDATGCREAGVLPQSVFWPNTPAVNSLQATREAINNSKRNFICSPPSPYKVGTGPVRRDGNTTESPAASNDVKQGPGFESAGADISIDKTGDLLPDICDLLSFSLFPKSKDDPAAAVETAATQPKTDEQMKLPKDISPAKHQPVCGQSADSANHSTKFVHIPGNCQLTVYFGSSADKVKGKEELECDGEKHKNDSSVTPPTSYNITNPYGLPSVPSEISGCKSCVEGDTAATPVNCKSEVSCSTVQ